MRWLAMVLVGAALSGCASLQGAGLTPNLPAPGATLHLLRDLDVPPGMARVHIQNGTVMSEAEVNQFQPYCQFMTYQLSTAAKPIRIRSGPFPITEAWLRSYSVSRDTRLAGPLMRIEFDDASPSQVTLANDMELAAPEQPGVYRLSCRYWSDPTERHLYLDEIRRTLAGIAEIRP